MTQTSGRSVSSVAQTASSSVSARISTASAPPSRAARSETCAADSSPVTSSARRPLRAIAPSAREQERRLPDARLAADEDERGRHEPAAEHPVELGDAGRDALGLVGGDVADRNRAARPRRADFGRRAVELLDERPERAAARALSEPAARLVVPHSAHVNWTVTFATRSQSRSAVRRRPSRKCAIRLQVSAQVA